MILHTLSKNLAHRGGIFFRCRTQRKLRTWLGWGGHQHRILSPPAALNASRALACVSDDSVNRCAKPCAQHSRRQLPPQSAPGLTIAARRLKLRHI